MYTCTWKNAQKLGEGSKINNMIAGRRTKKTDQSSEHIDVSKLYKPQRK